MAMSQKSTKKRSTKKSTKKRTTKKRSRAPNEKSNGKGADVVDIGSRRTPAERARAQTHLPGMEPKRDKALTAMADELFNIRTERIRLTKLEKEAADKLLAEMQGKKMELYVDTDLGLHVEVVATDYKVKVKKFDPDEE